jgi:hypothetical protein
MPGEIVRTMVGCKFLYEGQPHGVARYFPGDLAHDTDALAQAKHAVLVSVSDALNCDDIACAEVRIDRWVVRPMTEEDIETDAAWRAGVFEDT